MFANVTKGVVLFVSQPHNQTVKEGETAHFECIYQGSDLTPAWRINNTIYSHTQLPTKFLFNDQDFSLTINSVPESLNFTSFQCSVGTIFSTRGYLFVEVEIQNVSTTRSTSNSRLIQTTPDFVMTGVFMVCP